MIANGLMVSEYCFFMTFEMMIPTTIPDPIPETNCWKKGPICWTNVEKRSTWSNDVMKSMRIKGRRTVNGELMTDSIDNKEAALFLVDFRRLMIASGAVPDIMKAKRSAASGLGRAKNLTVNMVRKIELRRRKMKVRRRAWMERVSNW